jgi:hypothetical protein
MKIFTAFFLIFIFNFTAALANNYSCYFKLGTPFSGVYSEYYSDDLGTGYTSSNNCYDAAADKFAQLLDNLGSYPSSWFKTICDSAGQDLLVTKGNAANAGYKAPPPFDLLRPNVKGMKYVAFAYGKKISGNSSVLDFTDMIYNQDFGWGKMWTPCECFQEDIKDLQKKYNFLSQYLTANGQLYWKFHLQFQTNTFVQQYEQAKFDIVKVVEKLNYCIDFIDT